MRVIQQGGTVSSLIGQYNRCGYQTDRCQSSKKNCAQNVFYFDHNLCVTQFDSVFIYGLSHGPVPVLFSIHCPHSDCLRVNPDRKLIAARSNLKSQPQRPTRRATDTATDYCLAELTADKRSGLSPGPF